MKLTLVYIYFGLLLVMGLITLIIFKIDKKKSASEANARIPEVVLLSLICFGGSLGGFIGMYVLRHKTNISTKFHFFLTEWFSLVLQAGFGILLLLNLI